MHHGKSQVIGVCVHKWVLLRQLILDTFALADTCRGSSSFAVLQPVTAAAQAGCQYPEVWVEKQCRLFCSLLQAWLALV